MTRRITSSKNPIFLQNVPPRWGGGWKGKHRRCKIMVKG